MKVQRLMFVYAADSGRFNAFLDSARKLLGLDGCTLCSITHGLAGERGDWQDCKAELDVEIDYVHRDEMSAELRETVADRLPTVVAETPSGLTTLLEPDVLDQCGRDVADFRERLIASAAQHGLELLDDPA